MRRRALLVLCAGVAVSSASADLPDIRGRSFMSPMRCVETFGGLVQGNPLETNPFRVRETNTPLPHTFDIVADPDHPDDPTHIQVNTRLQFPVIGAPDEPDCDLFQLQLRGTYDMTSGEIAVSGMKEGTHAHHFYGGPNPLPFPGLPDDLYLLAIHTDFAITLHGTLTDQGNDRLLITGTDPIFGPGGGNATSAQTLIAVNPFGDCDPAHALLTLPVDDFYGGWYDWSGRSVPAPGALVLAFVGALVAARRRR